MRIAILAGILLIGPIGQNPALCAEAADGPTADWSYYGGDAGGSRYSALTQIDRSNIAGLRIAWEYHTGDVSDGSDNRRKSAFEATPIVADGTMYLTTPFSRVAALDPESGQEKWRFDPKVDLHAPYSEGLINRGAALWTDPERLTVMLADAGSFWRRSMRVCSRSMPRPERLAPISAPAGRST